MTDVSRDELNAAADAAGVADPESLPNKQAVADAIAAIEAPPAPRVFKLRDPEEGDENPVRRVSVGDSPRVSIGAGELYSTVDETLAARLAADELIEEVSL